MPENHPEVIAAEDKWRADILVFYLGRIAVDDFSEMMVLAGNGWGIGALKVLRGMYERVVTSAYIAMKPSASRDFVDNISIQKWKMLNRSIELIPDAEKKFPEREISKMEVAAREAKARREVSICKRCGRPKTSEAWTQVDLDSMSKQLGKAYSDLYLACYLDPTTHMHATGLGVEARMERIEDTTTYRLNTEKEANRAVHLGHCLLLLIAGVQDDYSKLGLEEDIRPRLDAYPKIWSRKCFLSNSHQHRANLQWRRNVRAPYSSSGQHSQVLYPVAHLLARFAIRSLQRILA